MRKSRQIPALGSTLLLLALSACGGGGSSSPEVDAAPALQEGLWDASNQSGVAYVLPASDGSAGEIWAIGSTGGRPLVQGKLSVDGVVQVDGALAHLDQSLAGFPSSPAQDPQAPVFWF